MKKSSSNRSKTSKSRSSSMIPSLSRRAKNFGLPAAGASLAGLAAVGAVGYMIWRNRSAIMGLLESSGILPESFTTHEDSSEEGDYVSERPTTGRNRLDTSDSRTSSAV